MRFLKLTAALLPAFTLAAGVSSAADLSRLNPAFVKYGSALSSSTFRTSAVRATAASGAAASLGGFGWRPFPVNTTHMAGRDISRALATKSFGVQAAPLAADSSTYDLRTYGKVTAVKDQGNYGTCWTFASDASLESNLLTAEAWDFSENNMAMNAGFDTPDPMNSGGNSFMAAAYLARWDGPVTEADDPYPSIQDVAHEVKRTGLPVRKHLQELFWLPAAATVNETAFKNNVKAAISNYGAAYISFYWDDAALSSNQQAYYDPYCDAPYGSNGNCTCHSSNCGGHAVAIVGWDDNYAATNFPTNPGGNGAFLAKNSWGASWGSSGYFYISYYDTSIGGETAVFNVAQATTNYTTVYQYDNLGYTYDMGNDDAGGALSTTEWMSNIFTASASGFIRAAGFYTTDTNVSYNIYVYTGVTAGSPRSGTMAYSGSGTLASSGFHTVTFADVPVAAGQHFSVVVKLVDGGGYNWPLPVEKPLSNYSSGATASAGQSYFSNDGNTWTDMTSLWANTNVCLKAYAYVDSTPPTTVANVYDGSVAGSDISQTGSITQLSANWTASSDPESGVVSYSYAIGTAPGATDVAGWTDNGASLSVTRTGLTLANGQTYYFGVKALNGVGLYSTPAWSNGQTVDNTMPDDIPYVHDGTGADIDFVSSRHSLSANWGASSYQAGSISRYEYAIGTTRGGSDLTAGWKNVGIAYSTTTNAYALTEGTTYYFAVRAFNNLGNPSSVTSSDGQLVDVTTPTANVFVISGLPAADGPFTAKIVLSEDAYLVGTAPTLSFVTSNGLAVPLAVSYLSGATWTASGFIESFYSTGTATFHYYGADNAGNHGTTITSPATFALNPVISGITGGSAQNSDGDLVYVPPGGYSGSLYVAIATVPVSVTDAADLASYDSVKMRFSDLSRQFSAVNGAGVPVSVFASSLTITMAYPDANGDGYIDGDFVKENLAWLYYLDEVKGKWVPLDGVTRDPSGNTLSAKVSHFSVYSVRALTGTGDGLSALKAYPNPCDFRKAPVLFISGLPVDTVNPRVYIYNEAGELVRTLTSGAGIDVTNKASWDGRLESGAKAASGLYIYLVKTDNYGKGKGKFFAIW